MTRVLITVIMWFGISLLYTQNLFLELFIQLFNLFQQNVLQLGKVRHHIVTHLVTPTRVQFIVLKLSFRALYTLIFLINNLCFKYSTELPV